MSGLPRYHSRFVGRTEELATVRRLLAPGRLVTLVAVGGAGKTRLAAELARELRAVWVGLAVVHDQIEVGAAVAAALGLPSGAGVDSLSAALARPGTVVLLDNAEHLAEACAALVDQLLVTTPTLTVLATSRVPLGSHREWVYALPPLVESAELFADRARTVAGGAAPDRATVAALCERVGGLPLAVELLAGWGHAATLPELAAEADRLLVSPTAAGHPVRDALAGTWRWLDEGDQRVLRALAVCVGGFDRAAAEAVAGAGIPVLGRLVQRALIRREAGADGQPSGRYAVHELVRLFALDQLRQVGEPAVASVRRRHAEHFAGVAVSSCRFDVSPVEAHHDDPLHADLPNLDAALWWAVDQGDAGLALRLALALDTFWAYAEPPTPRRRARLRAVLALPVVTRDPQVDLLRAKALEIAGHHELGDTGRSRSRFEQAYAASAALGDLVGMAAALRGRYLTALLSRQLAEAARFNEQSLALGEQAGDEQGVAWSVYERGLLALAGGDLAGAEAAAADGANRFEANDAPLGIYQAETLRGDSRRHQGRRAAAADAYGVALAVLRREGYLVYGEVLLDGLAQLLADAGEHPRAAALFGAADTWRAIDGRPREWYHRQRYDAARAAARQALGDQGWHRGYATGRRTTPADAVALAVQAVGVVRAAASGDALTGREREVLDLVAAGLTDRAIADRLVLSRRTVHAHLRSVYAKLGVSTRTAAVARGHAGRRAGPP